ALRPTGFTRSIAARACNPTGRAGFFPGEPRPLPSAGRGGYNWCHPAIASGGASPMPASDPVTVWIAQVKEGRRAAVARLLERYFQRLVGLARARLQNLPGLAGYDEDVALSAFKSLCLGAEHGRFPQLDDRDDLWRLLAVITVRKAIDLQRRRRPEAAGAED